jgi:hypothetical protein
MTKLELENKLVVARVWRVGMAKRDSKRDTLGTKQFWSWNLWSLTPGCPSCDIEAHRHIGKTDKIQALWTLCNCC